MTYNSNLLGMIDAAFAMIVTDENKKNVYRLLLGCIVAAALFALYIGVSGFMSGNLLIGVIQTGVALLLGLALLIVRGYAALIRIANEKNVNNMN